MSVLHKDDDMPGSDDASFEEVGPRPAQVTPTRDPNLPGRTSVPGTEPSETQPTAGPDHGAAADQALCLNVHRIRYAGARTWLDVLALTVLKAFRLQLSIACDQLCVRSMAFFRVEAWQVNAADLTAIEPSLTSLAKLGFSAPVLYHAVRDPLVSTDALCATLTHSSGRAFARITLRKSRSLVKHVLLVHVFSMAGDEVLLTVNRGFEFQVPPKWSVVTQRGPYIGKLWRRHQNRLASLATRGVTPDSLAEANERLHQELITFQLERGVLRPLTEIERERFLACSAALDNLGRATGRHDDALAEIVLLQNRRRKGGGFSLPLLVFSLIAFLAVTAAGGRWNLQGIVILVAVLLFHEAGHYVAMRMTGYRNVKMFFIPFLGAAVSGHSSHIPAHLKVLVSLAGPVPGIVIGVILTLVACATGANILFTAALMLLLINGFNLLPLLPLDGGRVVGELLLTRSPWFALLFRLLAIAGLAAAGFALHSKVLYFLCFVIAIGTPLAFRLSRIALQMRRGGGIPAMMPDQDLPKSVALPIVERIASATRRPLPARVIAQQALMVSDLLTAPPTWLATIALLGIQAGCLVAALVFFGVAAIGRHSGDAGMREALRHLWWRATGAEQTPPQMEAFTEHPISPASIEVLVPLPGTAPPAQLMMAAVHTHDQAMELGHQVQRDLPAGCGCMVFGASVLVGLSAPALQSRPHLLSLLSARDPVAADNEKTAKVSLMINALPPADAASMDRLQAYAGMPAIASLAAPWDPTDARSADQQRQDDDARLVCVRILHASSEEQVGSRSTALLRQIERDGDGRNPAAQATAVAEFKELRRQAYVAAVAVERTAHPEATALLTACASVAQQIGEDGFPDAFTTAVRPFIGAHASGYQDPYGASFGSEFLEPMAEGAMSASQAVLQPATLVEEPGGAPDGPGGQRVFLSIQPNDILHLGPVLVQWLADHGFTKARYMLMLSSGDMADVP